MGQFLSGDIVPFDFATKSGTVRLARAVVYVDDEGKEWIAPKGMESDGTSMPRFLWSILGHPFTGVRLKPSLIHDSAYQCAPPWEASVLAAMKSDLRYAADRAYLGAMKDEGDEAACAVHRGVRLFGWFAWYRHARRNKKEFFNG